MRHGGVPGRHRDAIRDPHRPSGAPGRRGARRRQPDAGVAESKRRGPGGFGLLGPDEPDGHEFHLIDDDHVLDQLLDLDHHSRVDHTTTTTTTRRRPPRATTPTTARPDAHDRDAEHPATTTTTTTTTTTPTTTTTTGPGRPHQQPKSSSPTPGSKQPSKGKTKHRHSSNKSKHKGDKKHKGHKKPPSKRKTTKAGSKAGGSSAATAPPASLTLPSAPPEGVPNLFLDAFQIPPFLLPIYQAAGIQYQVPWQVLAAINEIETDYGRNLSVSSAGAVGWMQFMPATWKEWGIDANDDGVADPFNPVDAIFSAARYLQAAGAATNLSKAIFAYNHADWYVNQVLLRAKLIGAMPQT